MHRALPLLLALACTAESPEADPGCEKGLDVDEDGVCDRLAADWSAQAEVPDGEPRTNIFELPPEALAEVRDEGLGHAQVWPVTVSGLLIPFAPIERALDPDNDDPQLAALRALAGSSFGFSDLDSLYGWLGLPAYNGADATGPFHAPRPAQVPDGAPMGAGVVDTEWGGALTFSCMTCHAGRFMGQTVVGLTNRRPRANEFFQLGINALTAVSDDVFRDAMDATEDEVTLLARTRERSQYVGAKVPEVLGLDTSLAQVALSLAARVEDPDATLSPDAARSPRENALSAHIADSKPMPWWNLKYKTKWLADGSIVSGNPIFTNFLWNEIGRGADLPELQDWMVEERRAVDTLTVAVFATEAPRWTDFFPADTLDLDAAKRGQAVFGERCSACHGTYDKGWDEGLEGDEAFATTTVHYSATTQVVDVGTSPQRASGMQYFADDLNRLAISQWMETTVEVHEGYVPPPLDAVWARYPYLHNNSVPSLCALLTPAGERPISFWQGPSEGPDDYDADCVGYPVGEAVPEAWRSDTDAWFDATREGLSNMGHDSMILEADGQAALTADERADLIMFLKTL